MPRWIVYALVILAVASLLPFAFIARARGAKADRTRLRPIQNMGTQQKYLPQSENPLFADSRAMRPAVEGAVRRGTVIDDGAFARGRAADGQFVAEFPVAVNRALLLRGQERYNIYCSPCHGLTGAGDGLVSRRADALQEGTWVPPLTFHGDQVRGRPVGHIFNTITHGIRNMPAYGSQIDPDERWAIVAYVRALQRSQSATVTDVPPDLRAGLR
ncbi:MAG: cytochrome c [Acidobacteria bacterium]|nr:cytochrome c [Acidobacteriota bacterium]